MSDENVEVVKRIWDIYEDGVTSGVLTAADRVYDEGLVAPDSTYTPVRDVPGSRTYVGREEFVDFVLAWIDDWDEWAIRLEKVVDAGDNRVLALIHQSGIGKGSGAAVEVRFGAVYTLEGGRVIDRRDYWVDEALELIGRPE